MKPPLSWAQFCRQLPAWPVITPGIIAGLIKLFWVAAFPFSSHEPWRLELLQQHSPSVESECEGRKGHWFVIEHPTLRNSRVSAHWGHLVSWHFSFVFQKKSFILQYLAFKLLECKAVWSPYPQPPFLSLSLACPWSWFGLVVSLLLYSELPQIRRPTVQTLTRKGSITQWIRRRPPVRHACIWISAMVGKWPPLGWNRQSVANLTGCYRDEDKTCKN